MRRRWSTAGRAGSGSTLGRARYPMMTCAAHSLGRNGRCRASRSTRDEVEQVAESLGPRQLLGPNDAEQQDHAAGGAERDDGQQVARAPRGEDVHQDQRDHAHPITAGRIRNGTNARQRHEPEQRTAVVDDAVRREDRHRHQRHHPRGVQQRLAELGEVEAQPVDRRGDEQVEVLRQEEASTAP